MAKYDIQPEFEYQNITKNIKSWYFPVKAYRALHLYIRILYISFSCVT